MKSLTSTRDSGPKASLFPVLPAVLSVSELTRRARRLLESEFPLLWVAGEISNLTRAASGHVYFNLKDEAAQVRCVMFRSRAQLVPWQLANGQQVEVCALPSIYEARGEFQLGVEGLRRAGLGRLYEAFARLRQQLEAEGLFDAARKRPLPTYPRRIGIVTSPQAAALQDVLAACARRAPHVELQLCPTPVQGDDAPRGIVRALAAAADARFDLLLVVRGGGSIEDLWAFNDEAVARALAASPIPTVVGVGHESDTTIADLVADWRAATPTAAAEVATLHWVDARARLRERQVRLRHALERRLDTMRQRIDEADLRLVHPAVRLARARDRLAVLGGRLDAARASVLHRAASSLHRLQAALHRAAPEIEARQAGLMLAGHRLREAGRRLVEHRRAHLTHLGAALAHLGPGATLARGYAIVRDAAGILVHNAAQLEVDSAVSIQFSIGRADARIESVEAAPIGLESVARRPIPD